MTLIGKRLTAEQERAVRADPDEVTRLLYGDLEDSDGEMPDPDLDIDKAWHGIHFMLTGTSWEVGHDAGAAILGGEEIGEDGGYGPARLIDADTVQLIANGLEAVDEATLRNRFDPDALSAADIYPQSWTNVEEDFDGYLGPHFKQLREFYRTAAANRQAVLLAIA